MFSFSWVFSFCINTTAYIIGIDKACGVADMALWTPDVDNKRKERVVRENGVPLIITIPNWKTKNSNYQARYDVSRATCSAWFRDAIRNGVEAS